MYGISLLTNIYMCPYIPRLNTAGIYEYICVAIILKIMFSKLSVVFRSFNQII